MEKVEKRKFLEGVLTRAKSKYVIGTILLSGIGIALPRIFHLLAGANSGAIFLPMHIAVLISVLTFGITSSMCVAGSSVIFSFLLTGMPIIERLPYMLIELLIYAVLLGIFNKKVNSYISLIATMVLGRIIYAGVLLASSTLGFSLYEISVLESVKVGMIGLLLQLAFIPFIASQIKKCIN